MRILILPFVMIIALGCKTTSEKKQTTTITPPTNTSDSDSEPNTTTPSPTPSRQPAPVEKTVTLVGSCRRVKANLPDEWLDCVNFYTNTGAHDFGPQELHDIQKRQCESDSNLAVTTSWADTSCSTSHPTCPKTVKFDNGVFGTKEFVKYLEAYKGPDCTLQ